jgi:hypothetical protein
LFRQEEGACVELCGLAIVNVVLHHAPHIVVEVRDAMRFAAMLADAVDDFVIISATHLPAALFEACIRASKGTFAVFGILLIRIVLQISSKLTGLSVALLP